MVALQQVKVVTDQRSSVEPTHGKDNILEASAAELLDTVLSIIRLPEHCIASNAPPSKISQTTLPQPSTHYSIHSSIHSLSLVRILTAVSASILPKGCSIPVPHTDICTNALAPMP